MTGKCSDIVFDDVRVINCTELAFRLSHATGAAEKPIRLSRIRVTSGKTARTVVDLLSPLLTLPSTGNIVIEDCQFEGPCNSFISVTGTVRDVTIRRNRCWNATHALLVQRPANVTAALDLKLVSNTFHTVSQKTLAFEALFPTGNQLEVTQNYFANCKGLVFSPEGKPVQSATFKANARDAACTDGNWKVDMPVAELAFPLDPNKEAEFLRYPKSSPLATMADGKPVGAPPVE